VTPYIPLALALAALSFAWHPLRLAVRLALSLLGGGLARLRGAGVGVDQGEARPHGGDGGEWERGWGRARVCGWEVAGPGLGVGVRPVVVVVEMRVGRIKGGSRP
jgi:hypothetical protein